MDVFGNIDRASVTGSIKMTVRLEVPLAGLLKRELEDTLRSVSLLVESQGLSPARDDVRCGVGEISVSADGLQLSAVLTCVAVPPAAWRVLVGLLSAFDTMAATIDEVRIEQHGFTGNALSANDLLGTDYPGADAAPGFALTHELSASDDATVAVKLAKGVEPAVRDEIEAAMNAWLLTANGGFFNDSEDPVTNAHDCPKVKRSGARLIARLDAWQGHEAAFDAVINLLAHFQRRLGGIEAVEIT